MLRRALTLVCLLAILSPLVGGCSRAGELSAHHAVDPVVSGGGKRVVVTDASGKAVLKLRSRRNTWKIYSEDFRTQGFVRWHTSAGEPEHSVSLESVDRATTARFRAVSPEVFELPGRLRIEKVERGWAVFDRNAQLLGLFERTEDSTVNQWSLRPNYTAKQSWTAERSEDQIIARHVDGATRSVDATHLSPPALLATQLDALETLERMALAAWFMRVMAS
ncbi:MAG: hypothetical protein H0U74_17260 [Bradymonadaceae bacterium]|nr:hypothetical protein [Lujinxingiaceae bacterium]